MLFICDFDGTITCEDVTNLIWDHFIGPSWRDDLLGSYKRGHISHLRIMVDGYKRVRATEEELMEYVRPKVHFRSGFKNLREMCERRKWPLTVVSGGLDFYIRAFLPAGLQFYSYLARQPAAGEPWGVLLPPHVNKPEAEDFKIYVKKALKKAHRKERVVFIGDGRNDLPVARLSDAVFAVRGSTLAQLCKDEKIAATEFDTFDDIVHVLDVAP